MGWLRVRVASSSRAFNSRANRMPLWDGWGRPNLGQEVTFKGVLRVLPSLRSLTRFWRIPTEQ